MRHFTNSLLAMLSVFLLFSSSLQAQELELSVDRNEVARGETLTLTIRVFEQRQGMQLDLTPLTSDFDVLGTRTSSQIRSINGAVESWTDYIVTLFPLNEGELEIPPLEISGQTTEPITITVSNEGPRSNQSDEELFLEIEVNKDAVYVQEQLLFTVRLYYTINGIRNPQFTELEMDDTVIQLIGSPNQYEKLIDGERFGVYEKRYVIFPQRSGPLDIPDILFRGEVTDGSSNFVFRNLNTRRVTAFIEGISIDVKERPAAVQNSDFWLPVSGLTLEETWSADIDDLRVGDSVVRTITMVAYGLDGAVLPPFSNTEIEGVNLYPDPADIQRTFVEGAIVGTRVETTTVVPIREGNITIPEISVPWWNIDTDQLESTVVPATRFVVANIQGVVPSEQAVASTENIEDLLAAVPELSQDMIDEQAQTEFIEVEARWMNYAILLAFLIVAFSIYRLVL
ncbi:MAG: protein BatD, partial [Gammaproteobacteria bacterium]|nr:protein BatD [Gammaproteobacteria bacterium]